jgi:hypothetical protein
LAWTLNDLTLGSNSSVEAAQDQGGALLLSLTVVPAEFHQLLEMTRHAGMLEERPSVVGRTVVVDTSPSGAGNTMLVVPDTTQARGGWFAVESVNAQWDGSTTHARVELTLRRICGLHNARGTLQAAAQYLAHDYGALASPAPASGIVLPVGAQGIRRASDSTVPTVRYVPVGPNLVANGGFETDVGGVSVANGASAARDTSVAKAGAASLQLTRGTNDQLGYVSVSVIPGVTYWMGAWGRRGTGGNVHLRFQWFTSGGAALGITTTIPSSSTLTESGLWAWLHGSATAPQGAAVLRVWFYAGGAQGTTSNWDVVSVQRCNVVVTGAHSEPASQGAYSGGSLHFALTAAAHHEGDVRVYDMGVTSDATLEAASYTRVYDAAHTFVGDLLLDNGLVRLWFTGGHAWGTADGGRFRVSCYVDGAWQAPMTMSLDTGGDTTASILRLHLEHVGRERVVLRVTDDDGNSARVTMRRGTPTVKVVTTRVASTNTGRQDLQFLDSRRFSVYNERTVLKDQALTPSLVTVASGSITEPHAFLVDPSYSYMVGLAFARKPDELSHNSNGFLRWRSTSATTAAYERTFWLVILPFPALTGGRMFVEAESASLTGGASSAVDAAASGGNVANLSAQNAQTAWTYVSGVAFPAGDYTLVVRAKDTAAVTNDFHLQVGGSTSSTFTLTAAYAFYALDFASLASGSTITVLAKKATNTTNTISVDYFLVLPRKRTASTPAYVFFPTDVARDALMEVMQLEAVQEA